MDYKLKSQNGRIRFVTRQYGANICHETRLDSAEWMLNEYKPYKSTEFEGYEVGVRVADGNEYFFEGTWNKPRRRKKDIVCE